MKKLRKLNLNELSKTEMEKRELYNLKGGVCGTGLSGCGCPCAYAYTGGSSSWDNFFANSPTGTAPSYAYS